MAGKKDYVAIAQIIKDWTITLPLPGGDDEVVNRDGLVGSLELYFLSDNPEFDITKFERTAIK